MNKFITIIFIAVIVGAGIIFAVMSGGESAVASFDEFAQCLRDKNIVMYGADWCPHCQNEKKAFGDSFQFIKYVECPKEIEACVAQKIQGYPTWIFPDGKRFEGEQGLEKLSH